MIEIITGFIGTGLVAVIGWAFQVHGRIVAVETLMESKIDDILRRLDRIERKLDENKESEWH